MKVLKVKAARAQRRKVRIRKRVFGTAERPRLSVSRSLKHISAQVINDETGTTLCEAGTHNKAVRGELPYGGNINAAKRIGTLLAERAKEKGVVKVCFDRNGHKFHGRVKALADAAREAGLSF